MTRGIIRSLSVAAVVAAGASVGFPAEGRKNARNAGAPRAAASAPVQGFDVFQIVVEKNIFNPHRVGRVRTNSEEVAVKAEEITLVGTMHHDRGSLAFFESPVAAYRKALREGETLGEFTVRRIAPDGVELQRGESPVALKITQQLRRVDGGEWSVRGNPPPVLTDASVSSQSGRAPAEPSANTSEVLQRLLKQREQQLKK